MRPGSPLSREEIARRAPLWIALSDLFLDTEMQAVHYHGIHEAARSGGFEPDEVIVILHEEVAPVLGFNLRQIAGEWAMFDPDWVVGQVSAYLEGPRSRLHRLSPRPRWPVLERILNGEPVEQAMAADIGPPPSQGAYLVWWVIAALLIAALSWRLFK